MKTLSAPCSQFNIPTPRPSIFSNPAPPKLSFTSFTKPTSKVSIFFKTTHYPTATATEKPPPPEEELVPQTPQDNGTLRSLIVGAVSVGVVALVMGFEDRHVALALGPGGPLMEEEFWDNVRRYALYALTVSTGALYSVLEPILELLKNPISAILILLILGGSFFILSQVVSAMIGVTEFSYDYGY